MASIATRPGLLGYENAAHLLRRSTFAFNKTMTEEYATKTAAQALNQLFDFSNISLPRPLDDEGETIVATAENPTHTTALNSIMIRGSLHIKQWWLYNAMRDQTIQHKVSFFLHTAFTAFTPSRYRAHYDYLELLRFHTAGSLKDLAVRVTRDIKMLHFLDNRLNTANGPNENYGREFLELFTIQKGPQIGTGNYTTYTESDVQQASRVFTGFTGTFNDSLRLSNLDPVTQLPRGTINVNNHDTGDKVFSAAFGNQVITGGTTEAEMENELDEFITMVFNQSATALSFARRIYRYFVGRLITPEIENDIIVPVAENLTANNFNLENAIKLLLKSNHFYDEDDSIEGDEIIGAKVKDPVTLVLNMFKQFNLEFPPYETEPIVTNRVMRVLVDLPIKDGGIDLFQPFSVAGYPAYYEGPDYDKIWISPVNLSIRYEKFINRLLLGFNAADTIVKIDSAVFVKDSGYFSNPSNASVLVEEFYDILFCTAPLGNRDIFFKNALLGDLSPINWMFSWNAYAEGGDETDVTVALDRLIRALIKSREYQVC